jgi:hypothetical protein
VSTVLVLRTIAADMRSPDQDCTSECTGHQKIAAKSFSWPASGPVECPDWLPEPKCGNGLFGLRGGVGSVEPLQHKDATRLWVVIECAVEDVVDVESNGQQKCKFRAGNVVHCGARDEAVALVFANSPEPSKVVFATLTGGYRSTLTGGYGSTLTGGDGSTLTIRWWNGEKYRIAVFEVGEGGIEANTPYRCDDHGKPVKVEKEPSK